ncbi:MAG: hypothetical protein JRN68_01035 [Nitrososphaerota archaeon]|nr:hypothetical protein [Ferrimicrobium acidiphilum]MDG6933260.1 hypothetical protein [Nitrososphaerota archaeon]
MSKETDEQIRRQAEKAMRVYFAGILAAITGVIVTGAEIIIGPPYFPGFVMMGVGLVIMIVGTAQIPSLDDSHASSQLL